MDEPTTTGLEPQATDTPPDSPTDAPEQPLEPITDIWGDSQPNIDDEAYRANSVPDDPSEYTVPADIIDLPDFDSDLMSSFQTAAHAERLTQSQLKAVVNWWQTKGVSHRSTGFGDKFSSDFKDFANRNHISNNTVKNLEQWFTDTQSKTKRQFEKIAKFASQTGSSMDEGRLSQIATLQNSLAYKTKGHPDHKRAVQDMLKLCQGGL